MSNTKAEAQRLADFAKQLSDELRRLVAVEQRYIEMMANPCPEWDNKAYMQAIANLRSQLSKAVAEEREACKRTCMDIHKRNESAFALECALAIEARSNT